MLIFSTFMQELNYKKIGERSRKLRKYMGLTQEQVADILGLGRDAILRIEKGDRKIDLQESIDFSKLYSISMDELTAEEHTINSDDIAFVRGFKELANNKLEKLRKNDSLTFPLDSFKILRSAGVFIHGQFL